MTEEIIKECEFYLPLSEKCNEILDDNGNEIYKCSSRQDCYYKQLKRLEQENTALKDNNNHLQAIIDDGRAENKRFREENKELKEAQKGLIKRITYFESVIQKTFNCLIRANAEGKITDTLWVTDLTTLWDMFSAALRIENIEEYENEVLNDSEC